MIGIRQPQFFTENGQKDNQEDSLYPLNPSPSSRIFVLCDGLGGHDAGEVASSTVSNALGDFLHDAYNEKGNIDIATFKEGLEVAYKALDNVDTDTDKKPSTTMACLCLNENSYLVAHIGDSRIYHIRPSLYNSAMGKGGIIYKSTDHSLVNDLLKSGELTKEQARTFPQKSVITRAMQSNLEEPYKADAYIFSDVQAGDYFFICSDGVLERLTNRELCKILADPTLDDDGKLLAIKRVCDGKTKGNYSCWLVPVDYSNIDSNNMVRAEEHEEPESVFVATSESYPRQAEGPVRIAGNVGNEPNPKPIPPEQPKRDSTLLHTMRWLTDAAMLLMLIFAIWMLADVWRGKHLDEAPATDSVTLQEDTAAINKELEKEAAAVDSAEAQGELSPNAADASNNYYGNPAFAPKPSAPATKMPSAPAGGNAQPQEAAAPAEAATPTEAAPAETAQPKENVAKERSAESVIENTKEVKEHNKAQK